MIIVRDGSMTKDDKSIRKDIRYRLKRMDTPCPIKERVNDWYSCKVLDAFCDCDCEPKCKEILGGLYD